MAITFWTNNWMPGKIPQLSVFWVVNWPFSLSAETSFWLNSVFIYTDTVEVTGVLVYSTFNQLHRWGLNQHCTGPVARWFLLVLFWSWVTYLQGLLAGKDCSAAIPKGECKWIQILWNYNLETEKVLEVTVSFVLHCKNCKTEGRI